VYIWFSKWLLCPLKSLSFVIKMAETQLRQQVASLQADLASLRLEMHAGPPTLSRDISIYFLIQKWSGAAKIIPVTEFFETIESSAKVGKWTDSDKIETTVLKPAEPPL
jgi:hypothetical protein